MHVTFDTNAMDHAARPERFPKDPDQPSYFKIKQALADQKIHGYFSDTVAILEGIQRADRGEVFQSTKLMTSESTAIDSNSGIEIVEFTMAVDQPKRKPLHPEVEARLRAMLALGMRALSVPRIGQLRLSDQQGFVYVIESDEVALGKRIATCHKIVRELENRGLGFAEVKRLANLYAARDGILEPWFKSLLRAKDVHEENAVKRAIAEWADADSVAAHIAYNNDIFCTKDQGKSAGSASVLDSTNRAWLVANYNVRFATPLQLACMV